MAEDDTSSDGKEFEPTPRKLMHAREKGEVIRSDDLQAALSGFGLAAAFALFGGWALNAAGQSGRTYLDQAASLRLTGDAPSDPLIASLAAAMALPALALTLIPAMLILIWLIASRGLVFAPSKLELRGSRVSLVKNFGQKFGRAGFVDFLKRSLRMILIGCCLTLYLQTRVSDLFQSPLLAPRQIVLLLFEIILGFLFLIAALTGVIGLLDYIWQRAEFLRRNRMSRKEMMDEVKDSEGDPQLKADRRRRAEAVSRRRMLADVPMADVIIVNPTHYAVALQWQRGKHRAPVCVAKGVDELAARIRAIAQEAGVPIKRDPPTARNLYASLDIGQEILPEHYTAVAAAIRFAQRMRTKMRAARKAWSPSSPETL